MVTIARTHVILDGLQDPRLGQQLSADWSRQGLINAIDVAGQTAWLSPAVQDSGALTEPMVHQARVIARRYGLEIRDRVGNQFHACNDLTLMRRRMASEYRSRFATALVFGLPALALHYTGAMLAGGAEGPGGARWMVYPWLFEMLLVGWACLAAGWPVLWQAAVSLAHLRATGDLLTGACVVAAFGPSAVGLVSLVWVDRPWFGTPAEAGGPAFHAAWIAITLAVLQRWLVYRWGEHLSGRTAMMLPHFGRLIAAWLIVAVLIGAVGGWRWGLAFGGLLPPLVSLGGINPWACGWSAVLPVFAFSGMFLLGPTALEMPLDGVEIETAGGFGLMMTGFLAYGWRQMRALSGSA